MRGEGRSVKSKGGGERDLCTRCGRRRRQWRLWSFPRGGEDGPQAKAGKSEAENTQMADGRCK